MGIYDEVHFLPMSWLSVGAGNVARASELLPVKAMSPVPSRENLLINCKILQSCKIPVGQGREETKNEILMQILHRHYWQAGSENKKEEASPYDVLLF